MNTSFIQKIVNRSNRTMLIWSLVGLVVVAGLLLLNARYFYNFVFGPFDAQAEKVLQAGSAGEPMQYWVNLQGQEMVNTGVQFIKTSKSGTETVEASYYVMSLGDRILLVRMKGDQRADTLPAKVTGWLSGIESGENEKILADIVQGAPSLQGAFLPFKLEEGDFRVNGYLGIAVGLAILAASTWGMVTALRRMADPNAHPILKALARFGPLEFIVPRIEGELAMPHTTIGRLHFTNAWLVYAAPTNLIATRYEDVVWVYKHVFKQKSYGITVSKTFTAKVGDRFGVLCDFVAGRKEETVNQMLDAICQRAPWAVVGYTDALQAAWKKDRMGKQI